MPNCWPICRLGWALLAAISAFVIGAGPDAAPARAIARVAPGQMDVVYADSRNLMVSFGPTEGERLQPEGAAAFTSNITVTYDAGFAANPQAQAAFQAAVNIWRTVIVSPAPIRVSASFTPLGSGILGQAGASVLCTTGSGVANTYYPAALADKLQGAQFCAALAGRNNEINAYFSSSFPNWDFGTSGTPVSGKYNFLTVVLHELGHGLGFLGWMTASGGVGSYNATPLIYDRYAVTGGGAPLLTMPNFSTLLGAQLVSNDTYLNGSYSRQQNGGTNPKLETHNFTTAYGWSSDNGFVAGSSYSHLDDLLYTGTPNGLMTFALAQSEVYTDPGPIVRGLFADEGWGSSTIGSSPSLVIDGPVNGSTVSTSFTVSGWAIDKGATSGSGIDAIHVYVTPAGGTQSPLGVASFGQARPDVGAIFGAQFADSGYVLNATLAPGKYLLTVYGRSTVTAAFSVSRSVSITVQGPVSKPTIVLDAPTPNSTVGTTITISGWAIDRGAPNGPGVDAVHVWAFPASGAAAQFLGAAAYGLARPDVGSAFGTRFTNSGYRLVAPLAAGKYRVVAYGHSSLTGTFNAAATANNVTVALPASNARLFVDTPTPNAGVSRPFTIAGWAVDMAAPAGTGIDAIHVWAFPTNGAPGFFVGVAAYGSARPDVGMYLGDARFNDSGFTFAVTSTNLPTPGTYDLIVFGHSTVTGAFTVARVVHVAVAAPLSSFMRDYIQAIFLGAGPLSPSDGNIACPWGAGVWTGFPRGTVVHLRVSTTESVDKRQAIQAAAAQVSAATLGAIQIVLTSTDDPNPIPGPGEATSTTHPAPSTQGCPSDNGCTIHSFVSPGVLGSSRAVQPANQTPNAYAHDIIGHGIMGMCHVDGNLIGGAVLSLMSGGPNVFSGQIALQLTAWDIAAAQAVYGSGLNPGATTADFLRAGLINGTLPLRAN